MDIPEDLLREANKAREIVGWVRTAAHRESIVRNGAVVGFYTPHYTKWGLSFATVYVRPAYRRRGLALSAYVSRPNETMWAFAADTNHASQGMLAKAGFMRWRRGNGGWFYRRLGVVSE